MNSGMIVEFGRVRRAQLVLARSKGIVYSAGGSRVSATSICKVAVLGLFLQPR